ncbi:MAG: hypothetical protein ACREHD_28360, partial [Pirellulales bacterium]
MAEDFDPYRKWLGIMPKDQPPNHYRLLGIELFESDLDVIEGAADRQMAHLRTFQAGQHSAHSQKLLNECAAARVTLLDPVKRAEYDRQLRAKIAASQPAGQPQSAPRPQPATMPIAKPLPQAVPSPVAEVVPVIDAGEEGPTSSMRRTSRQTRVWRQPAVLGTAGAILIFGAIAYALTRNGKLPTEVTTTQSNPGTRDIAPPAPPDTATPALPVADKRGTTSATAPATVEAPTVKSVAAQANFEILEATWGAED